ncbi:MAG: type I restriction endonuclease [Granulosicoccus sp.]
MNPDILARYGINRLRVDLVLLVNGLPVITMELKSEFKQAFANAVEQYKNTRLPIDTETRKAEPLLSILDGIFIVVCSHPANYFTDKSEFFWNLGRSIRQLGDESRLPRI